MPVDLAPSRILLYRLVATEQLPSVVSRKKLFPVDILLHIMSIVTVPKAPKFDEHQRP